MSLKLVPLTNLPSQERPREKLSLYGVNSLNDIELLAIILNTGYKNMDVKELAAHLLSEFGNKGLMQFDSLEQIQGETGLPTVKSCQLLAMAEYFRRIVRRDNTQIKSTEHLYDYIKETFKKSSFETLYIVCVDSQRRVLHSGIIAQGKSNNLSVSLPSIFHYPIKLNIKNFYLAHNHPYGDPEPSKSDLEFTLEVKEESKKYGLSFDDHIIIGKEGFYSFSLKGVL